MKNTATGQHNERKGRAQSLQRAVMDLVKWDEMAYNTFQYESGLSYLKYYLKEDDHAISIISASSDFWAWWRNHWTNRDQAFIEYVINTAFDRDKMSDAYRDTHDAETLAQAIYPNGVILNESYAQMITVLVEHEMHKS